MSLHLCSNFLNTILYFDLFTAVVEQDFTSVNEDMNGNYTFDQAVSGENEDEEIYLSRPYSSLYEAERGLVNIITNAYIGHFLDDEEIDEEELNYGEIYR